jgi:hypothetical protein
LEGGKFLLLRSPIAKDVADENDEDVRVEDGRGDHAPSQSSPRGM